MLKKSKAPITADERARLRADAKAVRATAVRKNVTLDVFEERSESDAAKKYFELGCWLYFYHQRIYLEGAQGLKDRIDCAKRIFLAGLINPEYRFFTVFDFGERQFDTLFEMGDAMQVIDALRELLNQDETGRISNAFEYFGWPSKFVKHA